MWENISLPFCGSLRMTGDEVRMRVVQPMSGLCHILRTCAVPSAFLGAWLTCGRGEGRGGGGCVAQLIHASADYHHHHHNHHPRPAPVKINTARWCMDPRWTPRWMNAAELTRVAVRGAETVSTSTRYTQQREDLHSLPQIKQRHALCNALKEGSRFPSSCVFVCEQLCLWLWAENGEWIRAGLCFDVLSEAAVRAHESDAIFCV